MGITSGSTKLPFDVCFPAHLKQLLKTLSEQVQQGDNAAFQQTTKWTLEFLMRYWAGAALGALDRLHGSSVPIPPVPNWAETLKLLRYAVMAWEGHPQSSFRTLLRLGFFEAGDPPRPRLQCRWLGIAGEWGSDAASAEDAELWDTDRPLPGNNARYLELISEWLRASRPLFVKLNRRYKEQDGQLVVTLEDGRGKQLPFLPEPTWSKYAPGWDLELILQAEAATTLAELPAAREVSAEPAEWLEESIDDILAASQEAQPVLRLDLNPEPGADPPARQLEPQSAEESAPRLELSPQLQLELPLQPELETAPTLEPEAELTLESKAEPGPETGAGPEPEPESALPEPRDSLEPAPPEPAGPPSREPLQPEPIGLDDGLDALLGLGSSSDAPRVSLSPRWRPRPLEFPSTLPNGVRRQMDVARRAVLDYANLSQESDASRRNLAAGLLPGISCLLELTARVACAGLAQVAPLPEPLRVALQQPVPAAQSVKLLHFAWTALMEYPKQVAASLLQALFFELNAPDVPRLHARWLGLPDAPMIGLQHVTFWVRLAGGQIQSTESEFQIQLRELLDALQLWLVAGSPLWTACDPELYIRPDGHWSGYITLGGERFQLDPETEAQEPLEVLLARWRQICSAQRPPFFVLDEVLEFVESVAPGSGLMVQGPSAVGKSFLIRDLALRQPQVGTYRYGWLPVNSRDHFALEQLNWRLHELHQAGFPWHALGPAALSDLQRHSSREHLFAHYFAALQERNHGQSESVRLVLLEDDVHQPDDLLWCHLNLPSPFVWVGVCEEELPVAWTAPNPPARLPIARDDLAYQKLALDFLQQNVEWPKPQQLDFLKASGEDLLVLRLWVGALDSALVPASKDLPTPEETPAWIISKVLEDRMARSVLFLLSAGEDGLPLEELSEALWSQSLRCLLQHYSWLVVERGESRICLRHPRLWRAVVDQGGQERLEVISQFCQYMVVKLNTTGQLNINLEELLHWITQSRAAEASWTALQSEDFKRWKENQIHHYDHIGQGYRKVQLVTNWLGVLDIALQWGRENAPLQLHEVLEEQLWTYSSRALTYRGLGRLHDALLDVEQAIAGFRPLVDQRPELTNGLAAAFNRRSEILRELGRHAAALQDADVAVQMYSDIARLEPTRWEPLWALTLHHRSMLYQEMGRLEEAETDLKSALEHYQPHRDSLRSRMRLDLVQAYLSRARLAAHRGDGLLARDDGLRCLELLQRFHEGWTELRVLEAQSQTQLAEAHRLLEDEGRALEASNQATNLWKELIDEGRLDLREVYAQELCRRGQLLHEVSQLEAAFEAAQSAVELLMQLVESEGRGEAATWLSQSLLLRGKIWLRRGREESAKRDLSLAFHYVTNQAGQWGGQPNNPAVNVLVDTAVLLAQLNLHMGQADQAVEQLRSTLGYVDLGVENTQLTNRALLETLLGRALPAGEEALAAHDRALEAYNKLVDEQGHYQLLPRLAEAHLGRARTYRMLGEEEAALSDANQAVDLLTFLSEKGGDPEVLRLLPHARFEAAEILGLLNQTERALEHLHGGLDDLEVMESDFGRAEYFLERARALSLKAGMVEDQSAADCLSEALQLVSQAGQEGAETQFLESEIRRNRAEVLLRLGRTAEAVEELLGRAGEGDQTARREQAVSLLSSMLTQAHGVQIREGREAAVAAYDRVVSMAELLRQSDSSGEVSVMLVRAYQERSLVRWTADNALPALADLDQAIALAGVIGEPARSLMAGLFEARATISLHAQRDPSGDVGRALALLADSDPARSAQLLWLRASASQLDAAAWLDLQQLEQMANLSVELRAPVRNMQARWLVKYGHKARAAVLLAEAVSELKGHYREVPAEEQPAASLQIFELLYQRFVAEHSLPALLDWAMWLGDHLDRQPDLVLGQDLVEVSHWLLRADQADKERFAQIWLAILAEHSELDPVFFSLVPACARSLRLDDHDSSTWISLIDIMDKRVGDPSLQRLSWEGKTLLHFLSLDRSQVNQNPDLDMALFECIRRWAELPSELLIEAEISPEAIHEWLGS
ncbi:MAG: hypothetical protein U0931_24920 [Vulcanimicrobiota bacterium]